MDIKPCTADPGGVHMLGFNEHTMFCGKCDLRVLIVTLRCKKCKKVLDRFLETESIEDGVFHCDDCDVFTGISEVANG